MLRRPTARMPDDDELDGPDPATADPVEDAAERGGGRAPADLSSLPIAGLTRRRTAMMLGALVAVWVVIVFARQVGAASAATARAEQMATDNAALTTEVDAMARELSQIQRPASCSRGPRVRARRPQGDPVHPRRGRPAAGGRRARLGEPRVGSEAARVSPLDRWLTLLFGPGD